MNSVLVTLGGFSLLGVMLLACRLLDASGQELASTVVVKMFIPIWLGCALLNLWFCTSVAGLSITDELPNFLLIFGLPTTTAAVIVWRMRS
ncbi:MAG: hypothetical protein IT488_13325 [Gammaproteobacteria bacterium]|nr:hypothetical protein [Gammaproteobacteria bacterium]